MTHVMHRVFWAWESEKEEKWLNEQSASGLALAAVGFCTYTFTECAPGEYIYRMELLDEWPTHPKSLAYIRFLEETGAEHIGSLMRWVYFRKKAAEGSFDLYSDLDSRIRQGNIQIALISTVLLMELLAAVMLMVGHFDSGGRSLLAGALPAAVFAAFVAWGLASVVHKNRRLRREKSIRE